MITNPVISVIVPVYNVEKYLSKCVNSILHQSYLDFELLLIDDGSSDGSGKLCDELEVTDVRIRVLHQVNQGVSAARNTGMIHAKGKYLVFVDSDDWVKEDYLTDLLKSVEGKTGRGLVIQGFAIHRPDGTLLDDTMRFSSTLTVPPEQYGKMIESHRLAEWGCPYSKLYDRSLLMEHNLRFDRNTNFGEDLLFMFDYLMYADYLVLDSPQEYIYVKYPSSLSSVFHSFEMEHYFFREFLLRIERLYASSHLSLKQNPETMDALIKSFQRALKTDYQAYHRKTVGLSERLQHVRLLVNSNRNFFMNYYQPACKSDEIGRRLLKMKCLVLYDLYVRFILLIRIVPMFGGNVSKSM